MPLRKGTYAQPQLQYALCTSLATLFRGELFNRSLPHGISSLATWSVRSYQFISSCLMSRMRALMRHARDVSCCLYVD
jgi:hypothetical protein